MTIEELRAALIAAFADDDLESGHMLADDLLLAFIHDPEVTEIFRASDKWYA